jgi:hypothetical protein
LWYSLLIDYIKLSHLIIHKLLVGANSTWSISAIVIGSLSTWARCARQTFLKIEEIAWLLTGPLNVDWCTSVSGDQSWEEELYENQTE